ncbi:hypothetical protein AC578_6052 [Pseudocercospora eumusae]|uniref:EKC/KEOPS complex subunit BUD32 n=1 Tax=Pseudocercospora eumusae TaxID=321146 RepID=A0A139HVT2_9PEZI|nr:hypothetical protein AC578_6052 [Pseudocercospora eumusae]
MSNDEPQVMLSYLPPGVQAILATGCTSFIGDLGNGQVLKYPHVAEDREATEHEAGVYEVLGSHPRILPYYGLGPTGLRLGKAANGALSEFLREAPRSPQDKLKWSRQLAEAVEYIHTMQVFHCDISPRNCFITDKYDLQLGDFQGKYCALDGTVHNAYCLEGTKAYLPRDRSRVDHHTDLFAVGSTIYEIMTGHEPYEHLDSIDDLEEVEALFSEQKFPSTEGILAHSVIEKCWRQRYHSARECVRDLADIEAEQADVIR